MKTLRRIGRIILISAILLLTLLLTVLVSLQIPAVQTKIAKYAITELNKTFDTEILVDRVDIDFFGDINLYNVSTKDNHHLDFVKIERVEASLSIWGIIKNPNRLTIKKLTLYNPDFKIITYKGEKTSNFLALIDKFSNSESKKKSDFRIRGAIESKNGRLLIKNENLDVERQIWIDSKNFNTLIENFRFENDQVWANLKRMNFDAIKHDENYSVKSFSGKFHYSKKEIRFDELKLETSDSNLEGAILFSYANQSELKDFANKVIWDVNFKEDSKVNFKDIRYFVPNFDTNSSVQVLGKVSGTLNNMTFEKFQLSADDVFIAANELNLIEMTKGDSIMIYSKNLKAKTSFDGLKNLLPTFVTRNIPSFIERFGTLDYEGDFSLDPNEINVNGYAVTALGDAKMVVNLKNYRSNLNYKGSVETDNLNLKQISEVDALGFISGNIVFNGVGTDIRTLKLSADGKLAYLDLLDKRYNNVKVDGHLENQKFEGFISIADAQLNADYDGIFDFSSKPYQLNFTSNARHVNLDYLGVTKDLNAQLSAVISGDFVFSNLDDFLGEIKAENVHFSSKNDKFDVSQATVISSNIGGKKNLKIDVPGYVKGEVQGNFKLSQLADAMLNAVGSTTLMTYKSKTVDPDQDFNFFFEVEQDLFSMFDPRIQISPGTILDGYVNTNSNSLVAELTSSEIGYNGINVYNPLINIDTSKSSEQIYIRTDSLQLKGVMLYNVDVHTTPVQDSLIAKTTFQFGKKTPVDFDLNLFHTVDDKNNLVFGFSPSTITVDGTDWHLNPNNDKEANRALINFDKNYYELQNLLFESEDQKLLLDGYYASSTDFKLNADLENLILSKVIPKGILGELSIDGTANGEIHLVRTSEEFKPLMELTVDQFKLNEYGLGDLAINGTYDAANNLFNVEMFLDQDQVQVLYVNGYIDNKTETPEVNLFASLDEFNIKFVESFLSAALNNMRGMVSGNLRFTGPINSPNFEGMMDVRDLGFTVGYLNVDYSFDGTNTLPVSKQSGGQGSIVLDEIQFRDTKYNSKGEVTGAILFRDFASWFLNLSFNTNNLLVMNTNVNHNELFYGRIFGQGAFELFGPPERLDISATAKVNENSEFTINTGATKVESENNLVRFIPELKELEKEDGPRGMNIDLDITATPSTTVNLIFDPQTGDMVTANGSTEHLKFNLSRTGNMIMNGTYTLETGEYQLRQIPLINRDFDIQSGSFVRWGGGSAFDADLNIIAGYERTVSNVGDYLGTGYGQTYDVSLGIVISETLQNPKMDFTLTIPKGGTDVQSLIDYKFNLDPDEKMVQFGSILLFGQFITESESILAATAASTGAGLALKQLAGVLNSLLEGVNVGIDYVSGSALSNTSDILKTNLQVDLSPRWTVNGAVGVPVSDTYTNQTTTLETEIQWDISRSMDKSLVINFFTRPTNFGIENIGGSGNFQSFGGGITNKTSFNKFGELFQKNNKLEKLSIPDTLRTGEPPSLFDQPNLKDTIPNSHNEQIKVEPKDSVKKTKESLSLKTSKKANSLIRFK